MYKQNDAGRLLSKDIVVRIFSNLCPLISFTTGGNRVALCWLFCGAWQISSIGLENLSWDVVLELNHMHASCILPSYISVQSQLHYMSFS